ncbi:MAG: chromosomal replication initiator protein DnaA [Nitrospinales bacterium]
MNVLWKKCLGAIEKQILPENFRTWFLPTYPHSGDDKSITIAVPDEFCKNYLTKNYLNMIETSLASICKTGMKVNFLVNPDLPDSGNGHGKTAANNFPYKVDATGPRTVSPTFLNPRYTFSNFIVGSSNQFANAASQAVAANPAVAYNPLFLYGAVGLGKTHLLHSIGNEILQKNPSAKIHYVPSEGFTVDLIQSIKRDQMTAFREKYRSLDVLIVDDIQFIAGKERTQEEFFYTFNTLFEAHKQVVVSSDTFPKDMQNMEERLRSRFECGLIADLKPPDLETKVAIIYKKSEIHGLRIPQDVALFIASNIRSNIRELEGLLLRLIAFSSFTRRKIDMDLAGEVLKEFTLDKKQNFTVQNIMRNVSVFFNVKVSDLKSKKRSRNISIPRQIAMFICREHTKVSLPEIGRKFGGKDHTTVIFSHKKIKNIISENNELSRSIEKIMQNIESE